MEVDDVVDTTGAGDYYTAAFAHAMLDGYDLLEAAWRGNVAGALNTTRVGAQRASSTGRPSSGTPPVSTWTSASTS
jgi:sugar/nucleoside kinase (ribokinase family)